jgi:hypothetical protein
MSEIPFNHYLLSIVLDGSQALFQWFVTVAIMLWNGELIAVIGKYAKPTKILLVGLISISKTTDHQNLFTV